MTTSTISKWALKVKQLFVCILQESNFCMVLWIIVNVRKLQNSQQKKMQHKVKNDPFSEKYEEQTVKHFDATTQYAS